MTATEHDRTLPLRLQVRDDLELGDPPALVRMLPTHMPVVPVPGPVEPCGLCGELSCGCRL